jgi:hypothetical protein
MTNEEFQEKRKEKFSLYDEKISIQNLLEKAVFSDFTHVKDVERTLKCAYIMIDVMWRMVAKTQLFLACDQLLKERMESALGPKTKGETDGNRGHKTKHLSDGDAP